MISCCFFFEFQRLEEIKKLNDESSQPKVHCPSSKSAKKPKTKPPSERSEELDKRFQHAMPSNGKIGVRKLYNHDGLFAKKIAQNENVKSMKKSTKNDCVEKDQRLGKKMPHRSAKNPNISYVC